MFKQVHHIGFAVNDLANTMKKVENYYHLPKGEVINIKEREMDAVLYEIGETRIEYLCPTTSNSSLKKYIDKNGEGIHHIAYLVDNIEDSKKILPEGSLESVRKSDVGNWLIADFKSEYNILGIKSQIIQKG
jgi:methylmalonyl-CoA/ethylmalonyl-CoA epimerase